MLRPKEKPASRQLRIYCGPERCSDDAQRDFGLRRFALGSNRYRNG